MKDSIANCIEDIQKTIINLEQGSGDINNVMKTLGLEHVKIPSAQIIALLDMLSDGITPVTSDLITSLLEITEAQKKFFYCIAGLLDKGAAPVDCTKEEPVNKPPEITEEKAEEAPVADKTDNEPKTETAVAASSIKTKEVSEKTSSSTPAKKDKSQAISSIRVSTQQLDSIIELVGKLMVTHAVIAQTGTDNIAKISVSLGELDKVIRNLQSEVDEIRLVPLKQIFMPMHRLVKSTSQKLNKRIKFTIKGEELALDKTIVESLNEPLVHLLRNALDHGIEDPEDREMCGKDKDGSVILSASRKGEFAYIEITDDGKGLDADVLLVKALERGLADPQKNYTQEEIYEFILQSGFSTAEAVTDISGRGVGMDAVVSSIQNTLDGKISIKSKLGYGSTFTIAIPLSRSVNEGIVDALIATVGPETFIFPSREVLEVYEPVLKEFTTLPDGRETVSIRGKIHPLIRMHTVFDFPQPPEDQLSKVILVKMGQISAAILVDDVLRQQKAVVTGFTLPVNSIYNLPILGFGMMGENDALVVDTEVLLTKQLGINDTQ
ncbi:two-component system, chemotaxis family, sensor kinase CheA [Maridesulfovibrio ferrireducens]|uniref:Chemotaxis protein CheA n=1 Tax=Maridesulfovibrio ferrireducens TaxID=246191 RepID=A0A1G9JB88_9BACT|nr:chemotaxis protein CheW [Maridesulfovibrio ferrireducens]SDL34887.1 two-component system, chemotaxis family, sensor kinase CheA [Maridesulfovibrio ferrireducens]